MTEELNVNEQKDCKCFCKSEGFKKFLTIALGTFVGVYCALCLFTALHRPPMMPHHVFGPQGGMLNGCPSKMIHHHHHFDKTQKHGGMQKGDNGFQTQAPFEEKR